MTAGPAIAGLPALKVEAGQSRFNRHLNPFARKCSGQSRSRPPWRAGRLLRMRGSSSPSLPQQLAGATIPSSPTCQSVPG